MGIKLHRQDVRRPRAITFKDECAAHLRYEALDNFTSHAELFLGRCDGDAGAVIPDYQRHFIADVVGRDGKSRLFRTQTVFQCVGDDLVDRQKPADLPSVYRPSDHLKNQIRGLHRLCLQRGLNGGQHPQERSLDQHGRGHHLRIEAGEAAQPNPPYP